VERLKVLCVDNEPQVLAGLGLHLRRVYEMSAATSPVDALERLDREGPFAVVLSDMRMPGMDGAAFLAQVRIVAPDATRMLLTVHADVSTAMAAVNEGEVFRFLTKPCPPEQLRLAFEAAARQYQLVTAQRVLLEQTLRGAVKALTDVLAVTSPLAFGRADRIRQHACALASRLPPENRWQLEVAAMLSQLGSVTLPEETLKRHYYGEVLNTEEQALIAKLPSVTESFLACIPRLDPVLEILARCRSAFGRAGGSRAAADPVWTAASILRIAVGFNELESRGVSAQTALDTDRKSVV
jgi:response regulator RpfG family c-di-GMP phosphodiesterase